MTPKVDRLLPWVLALAAGLVFAIGLRGLQSGAPPADLGAAGAHADADAPARQVMITEVSEPIAEVVLPGGDVLVLRPGTVGFDLARHLNAGRDAPATFPLSGYAPDAADAAGAAENERTALAVAAVMEAYPHAALQLRGAPAPSLRARLLAAGVAAERVTLAEDGAGTQATITVSNPPSEPS